MTPERWFDVSENDHRLHAAERNRALALYAGSPIVIGIGVAALLLAYWGFRLGYLLGPILVAVGVGIGVKAHSLAHHRLARVGVSPDGISFDLGKGGLRTVRWSDPRFKLTLIDYGGLGFGDHRTIPCFVQAASVRAGWGGISREAYQSIRTQLEEAGRRPTEESANADGMRWLRYGDGPTESK